MRMLIWFSFSFSKQPSTTLAALATESAEERRLAPPSLSPPPSSPPRPSSPPPSSQTLVEQEESNRLTEEQRIVVLKTAIKRSRKFMEPLDCGPKADAQFWELVKTESSTTAGVELFSTWQGISAAVRKWCANRKGRTRKNGYIPPHRPISVAEEAIDTWIEIVLRREVMRSMTETMKHKSNLLIQKTMLALFTWPTGDGEQGIGQPHRLSSYMTTRLDQDVMFASFVSTMAESFRKSTMVYSQGLSGDLTPSISPSMTPNQEPWLNLMLYLQQLPGEIGHALKNGATRAIMEFGPSPVPASPLHAALETTVANQNSIIIPDDEDSTTDRVVAASPSRHRSGNGSLTLIADHHGLLGKRSHLQEPRVRAIDINRPETDHADRPESPSGCPTCGRLGGSQRCCGLNKRRRQEDERDGLLVQKLLGLRDIETQLQPLQAGEKAIGIGMTGASHFGSSPTNPIDLTEHEQGRGAALVESPLTSFAEAPLQERLQRRPKRYRASKPKRIRSDRYYGASQYNCPLDHRKHHHEWPS
jgi:hypothetical protein